MSKEELNYSMQSSLSLPFLAGTPAVYQQWNLWAQDRLLALSLLRFVGRWCEDWRGENNLF